MMTLTIRINRNEYKKDYLRYFLHKKRLLIIIALSIIFLLTFLYSWVWMFGEIIMFQDNHVLVTMVCFISVVAIFTEITPYIRKIYRSAEKLPLSPQKISFMENEIQTEMGNETQTLSYSDFKEMRIISGTLFLVLKDDFEWPIRINKKEMGEKTISAIVKLMDGKGVEMN